MQMLWCWRCKSEMPMLDEIEYAEAYQLFGDGFKATKEFRETWDIPLQNASREERFRPLLAYYETVTGMKESNHNAVMHHRIAQ